jgi:hypothetical protein
MTFKGLLRLWRGELRGSPVTQEFAVADYARSVIAEGLRLRESLPAP